MADRYLFVLADSLAFHGPEVDHPPAEPRLYPNVAAAALSAGGSGRPGERWRVDLAARPGWTARDGWWAVTKDPNVWGKFVPRADVMVLGLGGMDQLPAALPTWLRQSIPYLRPGGLRRRARQTYLRAAPAVIRATDGRLQQLGEPASSHFFDRIVGGVRHYRPGLPIVRLLPAPYDAHVYPAQRPHAAAVAAAGAWCARNQVAGVELDPIVGPRLAAGENNPDGMHWGWRTHAEVGEALAAAVRQALAPVR